MASLVFPVERTSESRPGTCGSFEDQRQRGRERLEEDSGGSDNRFYLKCSVLGVKEELDLEVLNQQGVPHLGEQNSVGG